MKQLHTNANAARRRMIEANSDHGIVDPELKPETPKKVKPKAKFTNKRSLGFIFTANYGIILLMILILIGNTIGHCFKQNYSFALWNLVFLTIYLLVARLFNPLYFASDNKNYQLPKFNLAYSIANRRLAPAFLSRMGKNLELHAKGSLLANFVIVATSALIGILWYQHNWEIIGFPLLILFVARTLAANNFEAVSRLITVLKWILFMLFLIQAVTSIFFITPLDYTLWCYISIYNALGIWMRNMKISVARGIEE